MSLRIVHFFDIESNRRVLMFYTDRSPANGQAFAYKLHLENVSRESVLLAVNSLRSTWESARA